MSQNYFLIILNYNYFVFFILRIDPRTLVEEARDSLGNEHNFREMIENQKRR